MYSDLLPFDLKAMFLPGWRFPMNLYAGDACGRWATMAPAHKALNIRVRPFEHGFDTAIGEVLNPTRHANRTGLIAGIGSEVDALYATADHDSGAADRFRIALLHRMALVVRSH